MRWTQFFDDPIVDPEAFVEAPNCVVGKERGVAKKRVTAKERGDAASPTSNAEEKSPSDLHAAGPPGGNEG
jgi:hypothetical protein